MGKQVIESMYVTQQSCTIYKLIHEINISIDASLFT